MSVYTEIKIHCGEEISEILIAELYNIGYEGFWEYENGFMAYIPQSSFDPKSLNNIIEKHKSAGEKISFSLSNIPDQNWNEEWEKNFEPVIISNKYLVKAPFHQIEAAHLTSFTISPKMAFGTGHHATTQLMIELMQQSKFKKKKVLDLGTGTGILAIFAEHMGADSIMAIDNAPEAIDCCAENIELNNCKKIIASVNSAENIQSAKFDFILANINRNILVENASILSNLLGRGGILLISGFYEKDIENISTIFEKVNLIFKTSVCKNSWAACRFIRR